MGYASDRAPNPALFFCPKCAHPLRLLEKLWDQKRVRFIRIYKCRCGAFDVSASSHARKVAIFGSPAVAFGQTNHKVFDTGDESSRAGR